MGEKIKLKKIKLTENPNPHLSWWITLLVDEELLIEKFKERWGVPPRYYSHIKGQTSLIRLGPVPD